MSKSLILAFLLLTISLLIIPSCTVEEEETIDPVAYASEMNEWQTKRFNTLNAPDGWLSLVGLAWLKEGSNTIGASEDNDVVLPGEAVPASLGILQWENDEVWYYPTSDEYGERRRLWKRGEDTQQVQVGTVTFFPIARQDLMGIRMRDSNSKVLRAFQGTDFFPVDPAWRKVADFVPYEGGKEIKVDNIIGIQETHICPGYLEFKHEGKTYRLDVIPENDEYFIIFADETNGEETYGAGRYMYTTLPDENNKIVLDFNKSYNPPCVFTEFATCPLPPPQNRLKVAIRAGELSYGEKY